MYSLNNIFKNSTHEFSLFSNEAVRAIEKSIFTEIKKDKEIPYITCQIRNKKIKLTPEEAVRQLFVYKLVHEYDYKTSQMRVEHPVHFGRETKRADIVIFEKEHPNTEYIIIELKKPKLQDCKRFRN